VFSPYGLPEAITVVEGVKRRACLTPLDNRDRAAPRPYGENTRHTAALNSAAARSAACDES